MPKGAVRHLGGFIGLDTAARKRLTEAHFKAMAKSTEELVLSNSFPLQLSPAYLHNVLHLRPAHVLSVTEPGVHEDARLALGESVRNVFLTKCQISDAQRSDEVKAQLSISRALGGFGLNVARSHTLFLASISRVHRQFPQSENINWSLAPYQPLSDADFESFLLPSVCAALQCAKFIGDTCEATRVALNEIRSQLSQPTTLLQTGCLPSIAQPHVVSALYNGFMDAKRYDSTTKDCPQLLQRLMDLKSDHAQGFLRMVPVQASSGRFLPLADRFCTVIFKGILGVSSDHLHPDAKCICGGRLDVNHAHRCVLNKRKAVTTRHDAIVKSLGEAAEAAGCSVVFETRNKINDQRPDCTLTLNDKSGTIIDVDVSVVHAACDPTRDIQSQLKTREQQKMNKYSSTSTACGHEFVPFALTSMGTLGPKAEELLRRIAKHSVIAVFQRNLGVFEREVSLRLMAALHRGNYVVQTHGMILASADANIPILNYAQISENMMAIG